MMADLWVLSVRLEYTRSPKALLDSTRDIAPMPLVLEIEP